MNRFSYALFKTDPPFSFELTDEALTLSRKLEYKKGICQGTVNRGFQLTLNGKYEQALSFLEEAELLLRGLPNGNEMWLNRALNGLAYLCLMKGQHTSAVDYYTEAIELSIKADDQDTLAKCYINMGVLSLREGRFEQALDYYLKAMVIFKTLKNYTAKIIVLNNIGDVYNKMGRYEEALRYLDRSILVGREQGLTSFSSIALITRGEVFKGIEDYEAALDSYLSALKAFRRDKKIVEEVKALAALGELYAVKGESRSAFRYLKRGLTLGEEHEIQAPLIDIHRHLYTIYKEKGRFREAVSHLAELERLKETSFDLELNQNIKNVESESLKKANRQIRVISSIGRKITASLNMKSVMDRIYESVSSLMDASIFGIALYERDKGRICYEMFVENGKFLPVSYNRIDSENSFAALTIREKRDIIINDYRKEFSRYMKDEPIYLGDEEKPCTESMIFTPLMMGEEVCGAMTVQSYLKNSYGLSELETLKVLGSYIAIAINNARQAELIQSKNRQLNLLSKTDYLTGVYNRREFERRLTTAWNSSTMRGNYFSILLIDADFFKKINDSFGHPAGDECLKLLADIFKEAIDEESDCLARYGGEEFIILLNRPAGEALKVAEQLCRKVSWNPLTFEGNIITLTISIGVSSLPVSSIAPGKGPEQLIARADEALYQSKERGRNRVTYLAVNKY